MEGQAVNKGGFRRKKSVKPTTTRTGIQKALPGGGSLVLSSKSARFWGIREKSRDWGAAGTTDMTVGAVSISEEQKES